MLFRSFTNLIPSLPTLSWTLPSPSSPVEPHSYSSQQYSSLHPNKLYDSSLPRPSDNFDGLQKNSKKTNKKQSFGYVSKEKQILKLRERMIMERRDVVRSVISGGWDDVDHCYSHAENDVSGKCGVLKTISGMDGVGQTAIGFERCGRCSSDLISL